ncbi:MAG: hypothetical protein PHE88_09410 [Elusimicrobia bacterium]|nr:hypothetical protein [Elusimicrobiota bacterium]
MQKKDKIWIILILFIVIFQYFGIIFHEKVFFIRDLTNIFYPWKTAVCEAIIKGEMPLWNPYSYCGMPLMANLQTAVFYPFSVLFYIFGFIKGLKYFTIIHTFIAVFFMFLYIRSKKLNSMSSVTAGLVFAFGGYLITKTEFLSLLGTVVWLPLIIMLCSESNISIAGLSISFALFAGYPPVLLFIMILVFIELLLKNNIKKLALIIFLSMIISSIQILPFIELVFHSIRQKGLMLSDAAIWSTNYSDLISFISPVFLKKEATGLFTGEKYFWLKSYWVGFFASFVMLFGIFTSKLKKKRIAMYLIVVMFSLLFSLGNKTPVYLFIYKYIPGFNLIRYPAHILVIPFFIFIIFIAEGFNNIKKIPFLILALIIAELLYYSYEIHPTIAHNYYFEKGYIANILQKDKDLFRYFLTPKTAWSDKIKVPDYGDIGWYILKDRLSGLGSIPYHLYDAGGIGEPIEIKEQADLIYEVQKKKGADNANELLSMMNVKYLLSDYSFDSKKWNLVNKSHLFIYRNKKYIERSYVQDNNNAKIRKSVKIILYAPGKIEIETANSGLLVLSDTFYPGWKAFNNGKIVDIKRENYIFRSIKLENSQNYKIIFLYSPLSFKIGMLISLISVCIMILFKKTDNS